MSDEILPQPQIKISWLVGIAAAFLIFVLIGVYSSRMTRDYSDYDQDRADQRYITLAKLRQDEQKLLDPVDAQGKPTAEWVDQDKGTVRIPIEEAMTEQVAALKAKPAVMGAVIPGTTSPPAAAPPASAPMATAGTTNAAPVAPKTPPTASSNKPKK
jgi:hypothetical protein